MRDKDYIHDNLNLAVWLAENEYKKPLGCAHLTGNRVEFYDGTGKEVKVMTADEIRRKKKTLLILASDMYDRQFQDLKIIGDTVRLKRELPEVLELKKDVFERYVRERVALKIEYECHLHGIPYKGLDHLYVASIPELLDSLDAFHSGIKLYCPNGKRPVERIEFIITRNENMRVYPDIRPILPQIPRRELEF